MPRHDWGSFENFDDAKDQIYSDYMPHDKFGEVVEDDWAEALYSTGNYKAWAEYLENEYDLEIDMGAFWEDFRDAYSAGSG